MSMGLSLPFPLSHVSGAPRAEQFLLGVLYGGGSEPTVPHCCQHHAHTCFPAGVLGVPPGLCIQNQAQVTRLLGSRCGELLQGAAPLLPVGCSDCSFALFQNLKPRRLATGCERRDSRSMPSFTKVRAARSGSGQGRCVWVRGEGTRHPRCRAVGDIPGLLVGPRRVGVRALGASRLCRWPTWAAQGAGCPASLPSAGPCRPTPTPSHAHGVLQVSPLQLGPIRWELRAARPGGRNNRRKRGCGAAPPTIVCLPPRSARRSARGDGVTQIQPCPGDGLTARHGLTGCQWPYRLHLGSGCYFSAGPACGGAQVLQFVPGPRGLL